MGFEGPRKSIDEIRASIKAGEIVAGDKGFETVYAADGTPIRYNRTSGELSFTKDGILTEAIIINGEVKESSHKDADNPYHAIDTVNARKRDESLVKLAKSGIL